METKHILIVEDEWIIYDELASFLTSKGYEIAPYVKTYEEGKNQIKKRLPDIVLLDINLQGDKDGIDLGEKLSKQYGIPFIYLSAYSDEVTLNRARRTNPDTFLIKTKPDINKEQLHVTVKMALTKKNSHAAYNKEGIFAYTDYYKEVNESAASELKKVLLRFDDILWISTDSFKRNYVIIHTVSAKSYYRTSLSKIKEMLPFHFVRINNSEIINLKKVKGKINHSSFKINNKRFFVKSNYSDEVNKVLHALYYE